MRFVRPPRLKEGDTAAVLSPSKGVPSLFPDVYELGLRNLSDRFGLRVKEYPTARASIDFLYDNPKVRADDVNNAFEDEEVSAIIASIGGDESVRILPYLNRKAIRANPKILMGYSDTTTLLCFCNQLGLVTFHGPSVMKGLSQIESLSRGFVSHIRDMLFTPKARYDYQPYEEYSEGYPEWGERGNLGKVNPTQKASGWNWLQGTSVARGELFGGNIEVLEWMKGTAFWPRPDFWRGKILFFETSEEVPPPLHVERWLRNYGVQGAFDRANGLLFGRARGYSDELKKKLETVIVKVVAKEFGKPELPIVSNMDFGHTDPQLILPLGVKAEIDCQGKRFSLLQPPVA